MRHVAIPTTRDPVAEARLFDCFVSPEPNTGCWLWTDGVDRDGYGLARFQRGRSATSSPAHRVVWQLRNGQPPPGMLACHRCDTWACVNPDHIWPGTNKQNIANSFGKGRARHRTYLPPEISVIRGGCRRELARTRGL